MWRVRPPLALVLGKVRIQRGSVHSPATPYTAPPPRDALLLKFIIQLSLRVYPCGLWAFSFVRLPVWSAPHRLLPDKTPTFGAAGKAYVAVAVAVAIELMRNRHLKIF